VDKKKLKMSTVKAGKSIWNSLLILISVIMLIALADVLIPKSFYSKIFVGNPLIDSFIGAIAGSVLAGNPITSYILGGEFLKQGVSMVAVLSFIVAWVTVGVVQLPAESVILGKKFALTRNLLSFIFAILVALVSVSIWMII
jgi:uncharacterized membrane protein YraQ (UPF0718 family)